MVKKKRRLSGQLSGHKCIFQLIRKPFSKVAFQEKTSVSKISPKITYRAISVSLVDPRTIASVGITSRFWSIIIFACSLFENIWSTWQAWHKICWSWVFINWTNMGMLCWRPSSSWWSSIFCIWADASWAEVEHWGCWVCWKSGKCSENSLTIADSSEWPRYEVLDMFQTFSISRSTLCPLEDCYCYKVIKQTRLKTCF